MPTKAAVDKLHHLLSDLQHCVSSLESTYGDTAAMRRVVNDAQTVRNGIRRFEIDLEELAQTAAHVPCTGSAEVIQISGHRLRRQLLAGRGPRRGWRAESRRRAHHPSVSGS
jgi:hypothetical protein